MPDPRKIASVIVAMGMPKGNGMKKGGSDDKHEMYRYGYQCAISDAMKAFHASDARALGEALRHAHDIMHMMDDYPKSEEESPMTMGEGNGGNPGHKEY